MKRNHWLIAFHWLTALLVSLSFVIGWTHERVDDLAARAFWLDLHRTIGLIVLALTLVRAFTRVRGGGISQRSEMNFMMWLASRATHLLIYSSLIAMPLLGWAQSSAKARHLKIFGLPVPPLVGHDSDLADTLGWWHTQVGWAFLTLIGLHALAALFHHYVVRDDVLRQMLPRSTRRSARIPVWRDEEPRYDIAA